MTTRLASTPDRSRIEQGRKSWSRISLDANYLGSSRRTRPLGIWAEHRDPRPPLFDNLHQAVRSDGGLLDHLVQRGAAFPPSGCVIGKLKPLGVISVAMEIVVWH